MRPRRRDGSGPLLWAAAGVAVGAAAALLIAPSTGRDLRARLLEPLQKTGGGIGKRVGELVGSQVGAHPVATTKLVQGARDLFGTTER
jgi:gas vesicle protein